MTTKTAHKTLLIDYENNAEEWWTAAREAIDSCPEAARSFVQDGPDEHQVSPETAEAFLAWAATLPGWSDGPEYARHPVLVQDDARRISLHWDDQAGVEPGWHAEVHAADGGTITDSQKVDFPVDVDDFDEDSRADLEAALLEAFPGATIDE